MFLSWLSYLPRLVKQWPNDAAPFSATPVSLHRQTFLQRHHYSDGDVSIKTFSIQHKAEKDFELNSALRHQ
jgi:hypothetical protein